MWAIANGFLADFYSIDIFVQKFRLELWKNVCEMFLDAELIRSESEYFHMELSC